MIFKNIITDNTIFNRLYGALCRLFGTDELIDHCDYIYRDPLNGRITAHTEIGIPDNKMSPCNSENSGKFVEVFCDKDKNPAMVLLASLCFGYAAYQATKATVGFVNRTCFQSSKTSDSEVNKLAM